MCFWIAVSTQKFTFQIQHQNAVNLYFVSVKKIEAIYSKRLLPTVALFDPKFKLKWCAKLGVTEELKDKLAEARSPI